MLDLNVDQLGQLVKGAVCDFPVLFPVLIVEVISLGGGIDLDAQRAVIVPFAHGRAGPAAAAFGGF